MSALAAAAAAAVVLLAPFGGLVAAPTPAGHDYAPFRVVSAVAVLLAAAAVRRGGAARRPSLPEFAAIALALWAIVGLRWTSNPLGGAAEAWDAAVAALALVSFARLDARARRAATAAAAVGALAVAAYALIQTTLLFPALAPRLAGEGRARLESGRAFGFFITPGVLSGYLAVAALWAADLGGRRRFASAVLGAALFLPRSLSGPAAAAAGAAAGWGRRALPAVAVAVVLAAAIGASRAPDLLDVGRGAHPAALRLGTWAGALRAWSAAPLRGHGPGSFADAYMVRRGASGDETRRAHCWPLDLAVEGGLVAVVLWGVVVVGVLRASAGAPPGLRAAAWAFLAHACVEITPFDPGLRVLGGALFGLCLSRPAAGEKRPAGARAPAGRWGVD